MAGEFLSDRSIFRRKRTLCSGEQIKQGQLQVVVYSVSLLEVEGASAGAAVEQFCIKFGKQDVAHKFKEVIDNAKAAAANSNTAADNSTATSTRPQTVQVEMEQPRSEGEQVGGLTSPVAAVSDTSTSTTSSNSSVERTPQNGQTTNSTDHPQSAASPTGVNPSANL